MLFYAFRVFKIFNVAKLIDFIVANSLNRHSALDIGYIFRAGADNGNTASRESDF